MKEKPCFSCTQYSSNPLSGTYNLLCLACCRRLILSAHPLKHLAAGHLEAISRIKGAPNREQILNSLKRP